MALADPVSVGSVSTFSTNTAVNYDRITEGRYLLAGSGLDTPTWLEFDNTLNPSGTSTFVVRVKQFKNAPGTVPYGEKPQPDDLAQVHMVVKQTHRSFTNVEMGSLIAVLCGVMMNTTLQAKILGGQR